MIQVGQPVRVKFSDSKKPYVWKQGEVSYFTPDGHVAVQFGNRIYPVNPSNIKEVKQ